MAEFSPPPLRAPVACVACNKKKVRCIFNDDTASRCVNCERHQWPCFLRESKRKRPQNELESGIEADTESRKRQHFSIDDNLRTPVQSLQATPSVEGSISGPPNNQTPHSCTENGFDTHPAESVAADISPLSNPYSSASSLSFMARSRYFEDTAVINEDQARSYPIGDADGPTDDDLQILRLQGAFELPPRAVRDGLINTFMERCAPWMPIIERSWLEQSGSQQPSLLLLQSIFLAASRVTSAPAVSAYASTHQFYRRAKALFWSGYEKNPVTVVAAVCILHWYNPEGPEHVSTNTSGFWRYVGVGLAHQIGLHKEPTNKRDAALRRRLWWTLFARDCLISAGQGRPMAVHIDDCELAPPCPEDFRDSSANSSLFIAYVEISSILGHLTQHCRHKTLSRQARQDIENRLYRWTRELPTQLRLFETHSRHSDRGQRSHLELTKYSFEARQLHIPYFVSLAILFRPSQGSSQSPAVVLASAFVAGIFEDFLARDEVQFLGPIFTFHLLVAGIGIISSDTAPSLRGKATASMETIYLSLEVLAKRWSSAKGSLRALKNIAEKQNATRSHSQEQLTLPREHKPFFEGFGPDLCWAWSSFTNSQVDQSQDRLHETRGHDYPVDGLVQSQTVDALSPPDEYRPLTSVLDPRAGFNMADLSQGMGEDFFHNQYRGMGDWLFNDLDWNVDTCI